MTARHGFWLGLALGLTFALGFAAAVLVLPRAEAQSAPGTRWRYMTVRHGWDEGRWANEAGQNGWRFVGFDASSAHVLIFERPYE
ncbi:hypothetical protein [Sandaracinus amylolyticus]|uniref:hypothetical protein n=1 Tax=Sandaracinus amylolyticus TaxID=927083 RepID=UPI001F2E371D|nr:hypothetical protein [Sandaracinus amylolyticus]